MLTELLTMNTIHKPYLYVKLRELSIDFLHVLNYGREALQTQEVGVILQHIQYLCSATVKYAFNSSHCVSKLNMTSPCTSHQVLQYVKDMFVRGSSPSFITQIKSL